MTRLERLLILHEGMKLHTYRCPAGRLTIGVGRNLDDNPLAPQEIEYLGRSDLSGGISEAEALWLLDRGLAICRRQLEEAFSWFKDLCEARQAALIDMTYNLGLGRAAGTRPATGLRGFPKFLHALQGYRYSEAASEMVRSQWAVQVGRRAQRLATMMTTGEWPAELREAA